jgi:isopentenyldiphosphate isomerase
MKSHEWTRMGTKDKAGENTSDAPAGPSARTTGGRPPEKAAKAEEWFDVVDERDAVVGRATRREVHARGLLHRAVHILVYDRAGRVFLQKRSMKKDLCPGLWDSSASGHLDAGEDYDTAAVRELGEEIGIRGAGSPERWRRIEACAETAQEFVWVYRLDYDGPLVLEPEEIERGEWLAPAEVTRAIAERPGEYCPAFKLIWRLVAGANP